MSKILIVEDNAESRYMLERLLASRGHQIMAAENGEEALRLAREDPPEVIISDIMMPVMNGFSLCREIKKDPGLRHIPFVFYTGTFVEKTDERLAMSLGASRFVVKPTEGDQFIQILDDVLKEHRNGILPVSEVPLEDQDVLLEMYESSMTRKLTETVERLQDEQKALIRSEQRLKEAQELAHMGHWEMDLKTGLLEWSDEIYRILGVKPREFDPSYKAVMAMEVIHPDDRAFVDRVHKESLSKKTPSDIEYRLLLKDGTVKYVNERFQTLYDDEGMPTCAMGTLQDITDRKQAEEALQKSEVLHKEAQRVAHVGHWELDPDIGTPVWSDEVFRIFGLDPNDGEPSFTEHATHVHPEDWPILDKAVRKAGREGTPFDLVFRIVKPGGEMGWMHAVGTTSMDDEGHVTRLFGTAQDITELRRAQEALQKSEEKYRVLVENAGEVVMVAQDGRYRFVNRNVFDLLGYTPEELIGKPFADHIHPEDRVTVGERHVRRLKGETLPGVYPFRVIDREGKTKWVEINAIRIEWEGRPATLNFLSDISDRKEAEKALKEANEIINRSSSVAFTWENQEGWPVAFVSENVERLLGYSAGEFMKGDVSYAACIHPEDMERVTEEVKRHSSRPETTEFVHEPYRIIAKDGSEKTVNDWTYIVRDKDGRITHYKGIVEDITERRRGQEEREKLQSQLNQAQRMESIGVLAGGVAHDFNNLLTTIIGNAQLALADLPKDNPICEDIQEILKAGERGAKLTRQLMTFCRREAIHPEVLDLNDLVHDMGRLLQRMVRENIELRSLLSPELWKVEADPGQMEQVIMNLVVNARDVMLDGGTLTIETANVELDPAYFRAKGVEGVPGDYVMLAVTDTGTGMDQAIKERIFEPFFTTKERGAGTGLGLSTVYGIIKQSKGYIWPYSEPGKGTTMKVYLPRAEETASAVSEKDTSEKVVGAGEVVLVVEDEAPLREIAVRSLKMGGYEVMAAADGEEALRMIEGFTGEIHLLLTDVVMPRMGGKELAEQVRTLRPKIKVLYMSGFPGSALPDDVLESTSNFFQKPFTPESLCRKVREAIGTG
jgi:two-component system cell cycle sensor histidine kinase/response regulator CckA